MAARKTAALKQPGTRRRRGIKLSPAELSATDLLVDFASAEMKCLQEQVQSDGGAVLAHYREPLGGHSLLLVALALEKVGPTPFQRDVSDAHVRKLTRAMDKTQRFLDPIVA